MNREMENRGSHEVPVFQDGNARKRKPRGFWDTANITTELNRLADELGHFPTAKEIADQKMGGLFNAVAKNGGVSHWRRELGYTKLRRESGFLEDADKIEADIRRLMEENQLNQIPTHNMLHQLGHSSLGTGITKTGGYRVWRTRFGEDLTSKPAGFWQDPETIRSEAQQFIKDHGDLSAKLLTDLNHGTLRSAAVKNYPGGLTQLRVDLGLTIAMRHNYWSNEQIEAESQAYFDTFGKLTLNSMVTNSRRELSSAIQKRYQGGIKALRAKLGIEESAKPAGFWQNQDNIKEAAQKFYSTSTKLTITSLRNAGEGSLAFAIANFYPGGIFQIRKDMGIDQELSPEITQNLANEQLRGLLEGRDS